MMDADRATRAYTDVLAVEHDTEAGLMRIVTLSDAYLAIPSEGLHQCGDREYHDTDECKHTIAADITRGRIDAPVGWIMTDDLDRRTRADCWCADSNFPCFEHYEVDADGTNAGVDA